MVDVLTPVQRRLNMSRIRGRDTKPELLVRRGLHALGLRFRVNRKDLPGKPDLVFPRFRAIIFVHGCYWHGHDCPRFKLPSTRREFWAAKISKNKQRDQRASERLLESGWRVLTVWECSLVGPARRNFADVMGFCERFVRTRECSSELSGDWERAGRPPLHID
jgi:DNA mismatch endonuclease (patch repair protein)